MHQKEDPHLQAAAIAYDPEHHNVPVIAAYGEGYMAQRIVERAREAGVPVVPDPNLTGLLARLSVGDEIPPQLYEVVARVLVFVSQIDQDYGRRIRQGGERALWHGNADGERKDP